MEVFYVIPNLLVLPRDCDITINLKCQRESRVTISKLFGCDYMTYIGGISLQTYMKKGSCSFNTINLPFIDCKV